MHLNDSFTTSGLRQQLQRLYLWGCERLYAELAWSYDPVSWLVSWGAWSQWRASAFAYIRGPRVLEIGFGTGVLLAALAAAQRYQVVGLELSPAMQRLTLRRLQRRGLTVSRIQATAQQMPLADSSFDTIVATFPSNYIFDPATLRECRRLLRPATADDPGGRLVIVMGANAPRSPLSMVLRLLTPRQPAAPAAHERWRAPFTAAGLTVNEVAHPVGNAVVHLLLATPHRVVAQEPLP
jgi:ubiquinone/menaquinone biosynthesis C-methylase UbiE